MGADTTRPGMLNTFNRHERETNEHGGRKLSDSKTLTRDQERIHSVYHLFESPPTGTEGSPGSDAHKRRPDVQILGSNLLYGWSESEQQEVQEVLRCFPGTSAEDQQKRQVLFCHDLRG